MFKRWVGGFRVFYDAMFEICPPALTLFSIICDGFFLLNAGMLCTHFSFLNAGMLFTLFLSCMQVYFSPYSIPPNDGWQCDSNSAQEKSTAFRCCCLWFSGFSHVRMFIYLLVQFGFFRTCVVCVAIALRTSVYGTFSGYSRWVACCMSLLPIMALPPYFLTPVFYV